MLSSVIDFTIFGIRVLDVVDILIVAFLFYNIYKLLRGTIAFNIFIGVVLFYAFGTAVDYLQMELLRIVLGPFVVSGVLILIIIFQPEVRQFLLLFGNNTLKGRSAFLDRILGVENSDLDSRQTLLVDELSHAIRYLSRNKIGALIILSDNKSIPIWNNSGTAINADLNGRLLISIFQKESPLHDGAVIIVNGKIFKAEVILPVTDKKNLPDGLGLRHRAGIGISEKTDSSVFVVSEESGAVSFAKTGTFIENLRFDQLRVYLSTHMQATQK
jgi:uncharacterized protein (TIGR00159 family)